MSIRRLFVALLAIALFTMAVRETLDPDMWWHLQTGAYILEEGLPRQDVFSYTAVDHEWITHEWLSQVVMWGVYQAAGLPGLMVAFALIITLTYGLLYFCTPGRPYLAGFLILLSALASAIVWGARPQIFNLLLTAAFLLIVERLKDGRLSSIRILWLLPLLTVLWANLHSGYLLGVAILAAYTAGETLDRLTGGRHERTLEWVAIRRLGLVTLASFAAAALNPNGTALWIYPFKTLGSSAMQENILEWFSPDFHRPMFWPFAALLALGVASWLLNHRRPTGTEALLFMGTGAAGLLSARHVPLFALVATPVAARHLSEYLSGTRLRLLVSGPRAADPLPRPAAALNWLILVLGLSASLLWTATKVGGNDEAIAAAYPVAAVDFLKQSGLAGERGYNSYNWGGYLIWRRIPVFIDGRADVYDVDGFIENYLKTYRLNSDWRRPLDDYAVDYVLMEAESRLSVLLQTSSDWQEVYRDEVAQVFTRSTQQ